MSQASLADYRQRAETQLALCLEHASTDAQLQEAMHYSVFNGGKRIRPLLVYAAAETLGVSPACVDSAACAVELIHAYSLVHDDLPAIDNDDLRRGKPSTHAKFGEAVAILVGDALQTLAFQVLAESPNPSCMQQIRILAQAAGARGMVAGQMADIRSTGREISIADLEDMHLKKTGALITASILLGTCGHDAQTAKIDAITRYARNLGLAFQIKDDLLDATGDTEKLGKRTGADEELDKRTYVSLHGLSATQAILKQLHASILKEVRMIEGETRLLAEIANLTVLRDH